MAQRLECTALAEDTSSVLSTHIRHFRTAYNSDFRGSDLSCLLGHLHGHVYTYTLTHVDACTELELKEFLKQAIGHEVRTVQSLTADRMLQG